MSGNSTFHSSLPSPPVLGESDCPRVQNSWLGPKMVAQAIGQEFNQDFHIQ